MTDWRSFGGWVRRQCPMCPWHMDEPPLATSSEWEGDSMVFRVQQRSALPALVTHVVTAHPGSDLAREVRAAAAERGGVEQALQDDLNRMLTAAVASLDRGRAAS